MVANPGRKVDHRYRLVNTTSHDVKILDVINRKTCCGTVRAEASVLRPGGATDVEVTLVVGEKFGGVVHETEVVTDLPSDSRSFVLRTTAQAVPAVRVEEASASEGAVLSGSDAPRRAEFRVFASGTSADPPVDLDRVELRSTVKADWVGPKESGASGEGLRVESRRFALVLDPAGPPGERRTEVLLQDGQNVVCRHVLSWEVVAPITVSPRLIVMKPGQRDYRVLVASRDRKPFRITRIECKVPGVQGRAANTAAALAQSVRVEGVPRSGSGRGVVTVFTDHPAQGKVDVPFIVID